jgi:hypothetical protein
MGSLHTGSLHTIGENTLNLNRLGIALAIALIAPASPLRAEAVALLCQGEDAADSWRIQVDYDRKTVGLLRPDGTAYFSAPATITEGEVKWDGAVEGYAAGQHFEGSLNRFSAQIRTSYPGGGTFPMKRAGTCRRAAQKF